MNHDEAIRLKAAEKYLLGELSAELRDQYEDHYLDARNVRETYEPAQSSLITPEMC